jgi:2-keto-4-pentenoate hydratase/2-oxohepta-3-ene-1,7-dioic acid hydratase in catechol pathway
LYPRDIIATVTPAGVGVVLKPTAYLQQGDAINVAIEGTGFIDNKFIGRSIFSWRAA